MTIKHNNESGPEQRSLGQWLDYLESIHPTSIDMGLDRVNAVADNMSLHLNDSLVITVAGTNGKGTTCCFLEQALIGQGKSVAVYSSPHLLTYRERVRLNGELAQEKAFCDAFEAIEQSRGDISLTYFEFSTLAAIKMMQEWQVDVAILEVGLGGRLDATNIIDPDLSVITTIDLDHQDWLGNTREKIAREKAGILRANGKAVIGDLYPPASLYDAAKTLNANAIWATQDFLYGQDSDNDTWSWKGRQHAFSALPTPNIPVQNASTALAALECIDMLPDNDALVDMLKRIQMPGRQQKISESPLVVVDVAHNPQATAAMAAWLAHYDATKIRAVVGMLKDKSIVETLSNLSSLPAQWYTATTQGPRGCDAAVLSDALTQVGVDANAIVTCDSVRQAYANAREDYKDGELILVFGSFVTVADVLE